jgi:menaquinone-dependent protoporphyrinogen oxidase
MKYLIVFYSKYGSTRKVAEIIAKRLKGDIFDLYYNNNNIKNLDEYDFFILGSPVYYGKVHKKFSIFIKNNYKLLKEKNIALFLCGLNEKEYSNQFENNFPKDLIDSAITKETFGGEIDFNKINIIEKMIVKTIMKEKNNIHNIDFKKIEIFISHIKRSSS